ncbi:hypothetical protein AB0D86_18495 [Streptomyces sp. NPDC048324]|uniref:hypothetical protein n=1 Tax=Streptomyces sp. NPDC048324 TaxID=3157205 RepID=UPI00341FBE89
MSWLDEEARLRKVLALVAGLTAGAVLALAGPANPAAHASSGPRGAATADSGGPAGNGTGIPVRDVGGGAHQHGSPM